MNIDIAFLLTIWSTLSFLVHGLGIGNAAHAVMHVRSSQGAVAWSISLVAFPWLSIPLYWIFGRDKFRGYDQAMRGAYDKHRELIREGYQAILRYKMTSVGEWSQLQCLADELATIPFTAGNQLELLIDGEETFEAMLAAIAAAEHYILLQSYIVNEDGVGNRFREALIAKAKQGVQVYFLYDEVGSKNLPRTFLESLRLQNIQISAFHSTKGLYNRLQLNFRNHRKILVVDGHTACVGGLNLGDEYLGLDKNPRLRPWRDTHLRLQGPSVDCLQYCFLQDWYWATAQLPEVDFSVKSADSGNAAVFVFPTGPADRQRACILFYTYTINLARRRLWIASPYFVPDDSVLTALKLASMRGVDVRILLPSHADHLSAYLCAYSYYPELKAAGVKLYRYRPGFMHQKVILIDDEIAGVGTTNFDNRSFLLNFEVMNFAIDSHFAGRVEHMLSKDFDNSDSADLGEFERKPLWFRLAVKVTRLLSPVL